MAYVAVSGGEEAIATSIQLLDYYRSGTEKTWNWRQSPRSSAFWWTR